MSIIEKIKEIAEPIAKDYNLNLVKIDFSSTAKGIGNLEILIEKADGNSATVGDCSKLSKELSVILDVNEIVHDKYNLIISSAGMDRPLITEEDYNRFKGKDAKLELKTNLENGQKKLTGKIIGIENSIISLATADLGNIKLNFNEILKAKLVVTDEMIKQILKTKKGAK